jgi:hypothetical protein
MVVIGHYNMDKTEIFIQSLWYSWGVSLIDKISSEFNLSDEIKRELYRIYLRPNDWQVEIVSEDSSCGSESG